MKFVQARGEEVWEKNPHLITYPAFRALHRKWGPAEGGEAMYAIFLVYDPSSPRRENGEQDISRLRQEVSTAILRDTSLTFSKVKTAIKVYEAEMVTPPEKVLAKMAKRLDKLNKVMEAWHPDKDDSKAFADSAEKAEKMEARYLDMYQKVNALRETDTGPTSTRGGGEITFLESFGTSSTN